MCVLTFIFENVADVPVQLMVEGDVNDIAGGRICNVSLLPSTQRDAFDGALNKYSVDITCMKTRL